MKKYLVVGLGVLLLIAGCGKESSGAKEKNTEESTSSSSFPIKWEAGQSYSSPNVTEETEQYSKEVDQAMQNKDLYRSDITYDNLARTPADFEGEMFVFEGTILQVMNGEAETQYRVARDDNQDQVVFVRVNKDDLQERLLEDDTVKFWCYSLGLIEYETALRGKIEIPDSIGFIHERVQ